MDSSLDRDNLIKEMFCEEQPSKHEWSRDEQLALALDYAKSIVENKPMPGQTHRDFLNSMNSNPHNYRIEFSMWPKNNT